MDFGYQGFLSSTPIWAIIPIIATIIVHLAFSAAIYNDANKQQADKQSLVFVGPIIWALAVLVGGVFAAVAYWIVHHSAMSRV